MAQNMLVWWNVIPISYMNVMNGNQQIVIRMGKNWRSFIKKLSGKNCRVYLVKKVH